MSIPLNFDMLVPLNFIAQGELIRGDFSASATMQGSYPQFGPGRPRAEVRVKLGHT